jgi:hypothetical protein
VNPYDPFGRIRNILFGEDAVVRLSLAPFFGKNNKDQEKQMGTKNLYVVTMPATVSVLVEASDDKDAKASAIKTVESVLGKSVGILHVVGDAKATPVTNAGKAGKVAPPKDEDEEDDDEEEDEDDEEEEEDESSDDDDDEDEEDDDEEEDEDDEDEKPAKKKGDKKPDKKSAKPDKSDGKKKIKIKLKG